ncbi:unnamed protein product [Penicillium salamii]|nr:unnamed protein product [Penicillium salamii]CAG8133258.1 unnamed protein product [Penicillium salamii]CAG8363748.1 unnamed protein product [Penicillium salamii]
MSAHDPQDPTQSPVLSNAARVAEGQRPPNWVPIKEQYGYTPRKIRMICVGAGLSGLSLAHMIKHEMKDNEFLDYTIYDKNAEVGGVWYENKYPDTYVFRFEPNPDWSHFYVSGAEIYEYIQKTVRKWGLDEHVELNSKIIESRWDEDSGKWKVKVDQNGTIKEDEAEILVNGMGLVNEWKMPNINGLSDFKGKLVHTATWDESYDWKGKRVAVIGNGSAGIQVVTTMHPDTSKLVNYVRNPTWLTPNVNAEMTPDGSNFAYTPEERERFRNDPKAFFELRKELENHVNGASYATLKEHAFQDLMRGEAKRIMEERFKDLNLDPAVAARMIPDFPAGCRRLTPEIGYLRSFASDSTEMCWDEIEQITETGIRTKNGEEEFDMIICATGYNTSARPHWNHVGRNGRILTGDLEGFFSVQIDDMPNYFMIGGPNFLISHGTVYSAIAFACEYALKWIKKIATEDIKSLDVRKESVDDYNVWSQEYLKRTAFSGDCSSWYKNGKSKGFVNAYAGTTSHFRKSLQRIGGEHFNIKYNSANRFSYLGNGQMEEENQGFGDLSDYFVQGVWGP